MNIELAPEQSSHSTSRLKHSFSIKLEKPLAAEAIVTITNASESPYSSGWVGYRPFVSENGEKYSRISGVFQNGCFKFTMPQATQYCCWFPEYTLTDLEKFIKNNGQVLKYHKQIPYFHVGDKHAPCIVFIARQHPGETMSSFFLEGLLEKLFKFDVEKLDYSFLIVPIVNVSGVKVLNHRFTENGLDLNRLWHKPYSEIVETKAIISKYKQVVALIDLHGDEVSKQNYILGDRNTAFKFKTFFPDTLFLPQSPWYKRFLKNLIRQRKLVYPVRPNTAQNYFSKTGISAITLEFSAHSNDPDSLREFGRAVGKRLPSQRKL